MSPSPSPSPATPAPLTDSARDALMACERCGEPMDGLHGASVEVFERTHEIVCDQCADPLFESLIASCDRVLTWAEEFGAFCAAQDARQAARRAAA